MSTLARFLLTSCPALLAALMLHGAVRAGEPAAAFPGTQCKMKPMSRVCCRFPSGLFNWTTSAERCREAGGTVAPSGKYCIRRPPPPPKPICCRTSAGPVAMPPQRCRSLRGAIIPWSNCKGSQPICCKKPDGSFASVYPVQCLNLHGRSADLRFCSEPVCCRTRSGYVTLQAAQCTSAKVQGQSVDPRFCRQAPVPKPICCAYKRRYGMLSPQQCLKYRGTSVDPRFCKKTPGLIRKPGK